ncbi:transcription-repair coupling factor [bacterium]|nr:transcription-repair coupling factor [candidate division CSSED10-310 bacterium]
MKPIWTATETFHKIRQIIQDGRERAYLVSTHLTGTASFLAELKRNLQKPVFIVVPDQNTAVDMAKNLRFFLAEPGQAMLRDQSDTQEPVMREESTGTVILFPDPRQFDFSEEESLAVFKAHMSGSFYALSNNPNAVPVFPAAFLAIRAPDKDQFFQTRISIESGKTCHVSLLIKSLPDYGYHRVLRVENPGEFSFRGGILDIFIPIYRLPVRFEFFGDEVVSAREFDSITQRSISRIQSVTIVPVDKKDGSGSPTKIFMEQLEGWLGFQTLPVWVEPRRIIEMISAEDRTLLPHENKEDLPGKSALMIDMLEYDSTQETFIQELAVDSVPQYKGDYRTFSTQVFQWLNQGYTVQIIYRRESVRRLLEEKITQMEMDLSASHDILRLSGTQLIFMGGVLSRGFIAKDSKCVFLTERDIIGEKKIQPWRKARDLEPGLSFQDLKPGDFIVHVDHGIGQYEGLKQLPVDGRMRDFLLIMYAEDQKLYLPVERLDLIQRYIASRGARPVMDKLGGITFKRRKQKVKESVLKLAAELLKIFSERQVVQGYSYPSDDTWQREFEMGFEYEETPDQLKAISDVKTDMELEKPMDRLVCGDVGYGKTEVAMRAAFKAANNGKQVAVLVPTTILAQQHFYNFTERFRAFPVKVAMLSRFLKPADAKNVKKGLADGTIDIVIGTHALLSNMVHFKDLGLVVIDEEQRFGVRHKEIMKKLRTATDVLTLTATPIPRTLNMAMLGIRDVSLINTPPESRRPIVTRVVKFNTETIRNAILDEINRNGQIYIVHNRVQSIYALAEMLRKLVPEAKIAIAHGQMPENQLEKIMLQFLEREFDVLVSTTIIESGLDIPSVNTIVVNRADKLGLAQLYQLRGRVGRDRLQAYAYLLIPASAAISVTARERLAAIKEAMELGSGFRLASRDLEIRGAGDILGSNQHGHISAIGYEMYCRLIRDAVRELKGDASVEFRDPELKLPIDAMVPAEYIPDPADRLEIYRRFATVRTEEQVKNLITEVKDRFGDPPVEIQNLSQLSFLRILGRALGIISIEAKGKHVNVLFHEKTAVPPEKITSLLLKSSHILRFSPPATLQITITQDRPEYLIYSLKEILNALC